MIALRVGLCKLSRLNRRHLGVQKGRVDGVVTAVQGKIRRLDPVINQRVYQALDGSIGGGVVHEDGGLAAIVGGDRTDGRVILVGGVRVLELDDGVGPWEELPRGPDAHVEDHGGDVRGDGFVGVGGGVVHVGQDVGGAGAVDLVEEDAVDGDVGWGVAGPVGVDADVVGEGGVGFLGVAGVDVAERLDVRKGVEFGDAGDVVLIGRVAG